MYKKKLGNTDLMVAPVTLGGNVFGWTINEQASFEILDAFIAAGLNLVDTADVYARWAPGNKGGESETIIGNWMKSRGNRDSVLIATKAGSDMGNGKKGLSKKYLLEAVDASLQRLQTDHIDLYQTHYDDLTVPVEETLEAYAQMVKEGKVRWIGTSNMTPQRILESLDASKKNGYPAYQCLQPHYNLVERSTYEKEYEQLCLDYELGVINYYSLASGFLSGKYRTPDDAGKSSRGSGAVQYLDKKGLGILHELDKIAAKHSASLSTIAIAWLIARPSITAPIASATSLSQLNDLEKAATILLDEEDIAALNGASDWKANNDK